VNNPQSVAAVPLAGSALSLRPPHQWGDGSQTAPRIGDIVSVDKRENGCSSWDSQLPIWPPAPCFALLLRLPHLFARVGVCLRCLLALASLDTLIDAIAGAGDNREAGDDEKYCLGLDPGLGSGRFLARLECMEIRLHLGLRDLPRGAQRVLVKMSSRTFASFSGEESRASAMLGSKCVVSQNRCAYPPYRGC
jgi:hypothetical protein